MEGFEKFSPTGDWEIYQERLENYFALHKTEDDRKSALLINLLEETSYMVIRDSCSPSKPIEKSYEELCVIMAKHYTKTRSVHKERQRFDFLRRYPNEKVNDWYLRVKNASEHCKFGTDLEKFLTLKYISGLRGKAFDRICEENETLSLEKAHEIGVKYDEPFVSKKPKEQPKQAPSKAPSDKKGKDKEANRPRKQKNENFVIVPKKPQETKPSSSSGNKSKETKSRHQPKKEDQVIEEFITSLKEIGKCFSTNY